MKFCADQARASSFSTTSLGYKLITVGWDLCLLEFKHLFPLDFWPSLSLSFCLHPTPQGVYYRGLHCYICHLNRVTSEDGLGFWSFPFGELLSLFHSSSQQPTRSMNQCCVWVDPTSWDFVAWMQVWVS